jgi:uncharacterized membrane protein
VTTVDRVSRARSFLSTSLLGGVGVLLPIGVLLAVGAWVFDLLRTIVRPFTNVLVARTELREYVAIIVVLAVMVAACFLTGVIVRTQLGRFLHETLEMKILHGIPGYRLVKETIVQLIGREKSPFTSVALVRPYGDALMTAFVTDRHRNGWYSVFVPTGPNPTSGNIFHLPPDRVEEIDASVEDTMRSVIGCGAGSNVLLERDGARANTPASLPARLSA